MPRNSVNQNSTVEQIKSKSLSQETFLQTLEQSRERSTATQNDYVAFLRHQQTL